MIAALNEWGNRAERHIDVTRHARTNAANRDVGTAKDAEIDTTAPLIALPRSLETDQAAIDISGTITGDISFDELDITLNSPESTGVELTGAPQRREAV